MDFSAEVSRGLLVRPQPFRGEGLRGYFLRLADVNALLPDIDLYRSSFGTIEPAAVTRGRLRLVCDKLGLDGGAVDNLGCRGMVTDPTRCHYLGHRIAAGHLRGSQCAVCPRCLAVCGATRADWELAAQVVCPDHECWLVDRCARCRRSIPWRRRAVQTCLCGQDLRRLSTQAADPAALGYGRLLARRLFGDLDPGDGVDDLPSALTSVPMNQLLGLCHLFGNSRLLGLRKAPPTLTNATVRLQGQVSAVLAMTSALSHWPQQWHRALSRLAGDGNRRPTGRLIVSASEAQAPFAALQRMRWSAAADYPQLLRAELRKFLSTRRIRVGCRRYYIASPSSTAAKPASPSDLAHIWADGRGTLSVGTEDRLSADAVRDLFDASGAQMQALQRAGVLPEGRSWFSAAEVNAGFALLTRWTRSRSRATDADYVPLWDLGLADAGELELELQQVIAGRSPSVTWAHVRPAGLKNLFVPANTGAQLPASAPEMPGSTQ
jgi:hypothetical protein